MSKSWRTKILRTSAGHILKHPGSFAWGTLKAFRANQRLLLAGAVAYYTLLSIVPLLILSVIALSNVIDQHPFFRWMSDCCWLRG